MSRPLSTLTERLDALQADLAQKEAVVQAAVKKVAKAEEALVNVDNDEDVANALKEQNTAKRAVKRARDKLVDKTAAVDKARRAVRKGIDLEGKTNAFNTAKQAVDNVRRQIESTTREIRALPRADAQQRFGRESATASDDDELGLSQAEIYALVYNPRLVRQPRGGGAAHP